MAELWFWMFHLHIRWRSKFFRSAYQMMIKVLYVRHFEKTKDASRNSACTSVFKSVKDASYQMTIKDCCENLNPTLSISLRPCIVLRFKKLTHHFQTLSFHIQPPYSLSLIRREESANNDGYCQFRYQKPMTDAPWL